MKSATLFISIVCMLILVNCACAGPVQVMLKSKASVRDMIVRLGDIAVISGGTTTIRKSLARTVVATSPLAGSVERINRYSINRFVSERYRPIRFSGADAVMVTTRHVTYLASEYLEYAKKQVLKRLGNNYHDIVLTPVGLYRNLEVPLGNLSLSVKSGGATITDGRTQVSVHISVNNKFYTMLPIWFRVEGKLKVYIASKGIRKYQNIAPNMISENYVAIASVQGKPIPCRKVLGQYISTNNINPGVVLTMNNTEHNKLVVKGQDIRVISRSGGITLSLTATALEAGKKGDFIKLRNKSSNKVFLGEIIGAHRARSL